MFWVWFGPALDPNPARNRIFPAGSINVFSGPCSSAELHLLATYVLGFSVASRTSHGLFALNVGFVQFSEQTREVFACFTHGCGQPHSLSLHVLTQLVQAPVVVVDFARLSCDGCKLSGPISPVWAPISGNAESHKQPARHVQFVGRWFLEHEPALLQDMVVAEASA